MKLKPLSCFVSGSLLTVAHFAAAARPGDFDLPAVTPSADVRVAGSETAPTGDMTLLTRPLPQRQTSPVSEKRLAKDLPENLLPAVPRPAAPASPSGTPIVLENENLRQVEQLLRALR